MPRTPLFALLRRSLRVADASRADPRPLDEIMDETRLRRALAHPVTRRDFVAAGTALGTVAALDACLPRGTTPRPAPRRDLPPVIVVGAGIAGLTAAYRLRQAGVPVRVYEAQSRVGGRMFSLRDRFPDGQVVELGGELIDTGHTRIRALAAELRIPLDDLASDDPTLAGEVWHFGGQRRTEAEVVAAFVPVAERVRADLATLRGDDVTYRTPVGAERLDRLSLAGWLDANGVSGWFRALLDVGYTTEFGLEIDRLSALDFLTMVDPEPDPFRIYGESDERFHVRGGNDRITSALAERLDDAIETDTVLEAVRAQGDGGFVCTFRRGSGTMDVSAPQVVLAIPFTLLRDVRLDVPLPPVKRRAIAELGYGTNAKLMVAFDQRVWRTVQGCNGSTLTDLPYQLTWETSRLQPGRSGVLTNFTGGAHGVALGQGTAAEQARLLVRDLDRLFPGVAAARANMPEARFHWPSFPWTRGSYATYLPGQWTGLRGAEAEPVGALFFAGEHCSLEAQGFMEGGCETGEVAAAGIARRVGVRPEPRRLLGVV